MASRRSLTTTTAVAGGLLAALCFVPSASATVEHPAPARQGSPHHTAPLHRTAAGSGSGSGSGAAAGAGAGAGAANSTTPQADTLNLADTGSVDTTPYVVGGTAFLAAGTALLVVSRRRALTAPAGG